MHHLPLSLPSLEENLACDEALLLAAEQGTGGECLRLWEWPHPAVVLGAAGIINEDVNVEQCRRDGVTIARRSSGGGTVLLGNGCLLFSLVLAYDRAEDLKQIGCSYCCILGKIKQALEESTSGIELAGTSDLAIGCKKFSGNSQQRKRNHLLHHGTILYDFDFQSMDSYLHSPQRQPAYRKNRDHQTFLTNLRMAKEQIQQQLRKAWRADQEIGEWPEDLAGQLLAQKYRQDNWLWRR